MNYLKCPICFDIFSNAKIPYALPCGHTICSDCFIQIKKECLEDYKTYKSDDSDDSESFHRNNKNSKNKKDKKKGDEQEEDDYTIEDPLNIKKDEQQNADEDDYSSVSHSDNHTSDYVDNNSGEEDDGDEEDEDEEDEDTEEEDDDDDEENDQWNTIIENDEGNNFGKKKEDTFKFKCPFCLNRIKISSSKIIMNSTVLQFNLNIRAGQSKENTSEIINKVFCKICGIVDCYQNHFQKNSSFHNEYCVDLSNNNFEKVKSSLKEIKFQENKDKCITFLKILIEKLFSINNLSKKIRMQSLNTPEDEELIGKMYRKKFSVLQKTFKEEMKNMNKENNAQKKSKSMQAIEGCMQTAENLLLKYKSFFFYSMNKLSVSIHKQSNFLVLLKYLFQNSVIKLLSNNFLHSALNDLILNQNQHILIHDNKNNQFFIYDSLFSRYLQLNLPSKKFKFNLKSQEISPENHDIFFLGEKNAKSTKFVCMNPISKTMTLLPPIPEPFYKCDTCYYQDNIYLIGGKTGKLTYCSKCYVYNIKNKMWSKLPDLNLKKARKAIICTGNMIYALGGKGKEISDSYTFEKLDLSKNNSKWEKFNIQFYNEPLFNFGYWLYNKNIVIILGGDSLVLEDYQSTGYVIDLAKEKLITSFAIKSCFVSNYGNSKNFMGKLIVSDKSIDKEDIFNVWQQLEHLKITF